MAIIEFKLPTKIKFGVDSIECLHDTIKQYGGRVVIVTDGNSFNQIGVIDKIVSKLEDNLMNVMVYSKVNSNSNSDESDIIANLIRYSKAECLVAIGGFKVQNIAKGASVVVTNSGEASDYVSGQTAYHKPFPLISVPTILGSLSEITTGMYLVDKYDGICKESTDKNIYARDCIIDSALYTTVPVKYSISSALSVFAMAFDLYMSTTLNDINAPLIKNAMKSSIKGLSKLILDSSNVENISNIAMANMMCAMASSNANLGASRALSIAINNMYDVNKSIIASMLLPHIMEYYIPVVPDKYTILADFINGVDPEMTPFEIASQSGEYIKKLLHDLNLPRRLNEINIDRSKFNNVADIALTYSGMDKLPKAMTHDAITTILDQAY